MLDAAGGPEQKTARLGFVFDQHAHDVAAAGNADPEDKNHGSGVPSDDVIHLPKYFVTEERMPFTTREVLTPEGRVTLANKRYISPVYRKTLGPLAAVAALLMNPLGGWRPNDAEAMTLYEGDECKRRKMETAELMKLDALSE